MNNLILSLIAVIFAVVLVFAGVNYLERASVTRVTVSTDSIADIEQMVDDYQNLRVNLGRRPNGVDYTAVYNGQSTNSTYSYVSGPPVRPSSLMGAVSIDGIAKPGWAYAPGCGTGASTDCFFLKVDPGTLPAKQAALTYQAAQLAAKKETNGKNSSIIGLVWNGTCSTSSGCTVAPTTDPSAWPASLNSAYYLSVQLAPAGAGGCTGGGGCTYGDTFEACGATWNETTQSSAACPGTGAIGQEILTYHTPYICAGVNNPLQDGAQALYNTDTSDCAACNSSIDTCNYGAAGGYGTNSSTNSVTWTCTSSDGANTAACSYACPGGEIASSGSCQCPASTGTVNYGPAPSCTPSCAATAPTGGSLTAVPNCAPACPNSFTYDASTNACIQNGLCGTACGVADPNNPGGDGSQLCSAGNATAVTLVGSNWIWTCNGINPGSTNAPGSAPLACQSGYAMVNGVCQPVVNGACGSACGVPDANNPGTDGSQLCSAGNATSVALVGSNWIWACDGVNGGTNAPGSAPLACQSGYTMVNGVCQPIVNGMCGTACGVPDANNPGGDGSQLCSAGNATAVTLVGSNWLWACDGINGGTNAPGSAPLACQPGYTMVSGACQPIVNGACGSACGVPDASNPGGDGSQLCSAGNATAVTLVGSNWTWTCDGINPGSTNAPGSAPLACQSGYTLSNGKCFVNSACGSDAGGPIYYNPKYGAPYPVNTCTNGGTTIGLTLSNSPYNDIDKDYTWSCSNAGGSITAASCTMEIEATLTCLNPDYTHCNPGVTK